MAGLEPEPITEPMDVFWFRLPKTPADADAEMSGLMGGGRLPFISLERDDHWQCGLVFPHGGYTMMKEKGMDALRGYVAEAAPQLADRLESHLTEWRDLAWLTVAGARLNQWWQPGLLFIGDAAHIMTPLGGVGINYAIQDEIEAANVLVQPLRTNTLTDQHLANQYLAEVQRRREWPTKVIQAIQATGQKRILAPGLLLDEPFVIPPFLRALPHIPPLRSLPSRMIGIGARRVKIDPILLG